MVKRSHLFIFIFLLVSTLTLIGIGLFLRNSILTGKTVKISHQQLTEVYESADSTAKDVVGSNPFDTATNEGISHATTGADDIILVGKVEGDIPILIDNNTAELVLKANDISHSIVITQETLYSKSASSIMDISEISPREIKQGDTVRIHAEVTRNSIVASDIMKL